MKLLNYDEVLDCDSYLSDIAVFPDYIKICGGNTHIQIFKDILDIGLKNGVIKAVAFSEGLILCNDLEEEEK